LRTRGKGGVGRVVGVDWRDVKKVTLGQLLSVDRCKDIAMTRYKEMFDLEEGVVILSRMRIEVITTGSELLLGQVMNSHPGYLSARLATLGLELVRQTAVGADVG